MDPEEQVEKQPEKGGGARDLGAKPDGDRGLDRDPGVDTRSRQIAGQEASRGQAGAAAAGGQAAPAAVSRGPVLPGLVMSQTAPTGIAVFEASVALDLLPPELAPIDPQVPDVSAGLLVDGDHLIVHVAVGPDHWVASLSAVQVAETLAGRDGVAMLGSAAGLLKELPARIRKVGTKARIRLWGSAPTESFVVVDLARIVRGLGRGTLGGLRPVEAQLLLGDPVKGESGVGVRMFGSDKDSQVTAATAIPGEPIGDWFAIDETPEMRFALGTDEAVDANASPGKVWAGVFYEAGVIRVALKPTKDAAKGIAAHINLAYLGEKLKALGAKAQEWISQFLDSLSLPKMPSIGRLHFSLPKLPGTWLDFDFKLQLPRLFRGGGGGGLGFDLSGLLPSSFNFDFGGLSLGAMPKLSFPWLRAPKLGGFDVDWSKLSNLLPSLPDVSLPKLPKLNFGLHVAGGFKLGFGTDLSLAWPDLGDLSLGFTLDLEKILDKIAGAGKWLLKKLRAAGDFINRWIHLGDDGVLRIYDKHRPDGPMLGFHLLRLLDGADATDLAPTELRFTEGQAGIALEMGEKHEDGAAEGPKGKGSPQRPTGTMITETTIVAPPSLQTALALAPAAEVRAELWAEGDHVVVWSEAASSLYANGQAVRSSLNVRSLANAALAKWPAGKMKPPIETFELDKTQGGDGPRINFGLPTAVGVKGKTSKVSGHALWKLEHIVKAQDWSALVPSELEVNVDGAGGVQLGKLHPPGEPIGGRIEVHAKTLREKLLHEPEGDTVWAGVHHKGDLVALSVTKEEAGDEGALAQVHISFLLAQLKKLGDAGRRALEWIADIKLPGWRASGGKSDVFARIQDIVDALAAAGQKVLDFVGGLLRLHLPNGKWIGWNLKAQLPHIGLDLDLASLVPEFDLALPALPGLPDWSISFQPSSSWGNPLEGLSFKLPELGLRDLLGSLPNVKLPKSFDVNLSWIGDLLGVYIDLGDLFGSGEKLSFGFKLPIDAMLDKLKKLGKWVGNTGGRIEDHLHLGSDGVLRIFDPAKPDLRVGFDLKKLFDGVQPEDLVPVELHGEIERKGHTLAEVSYGDAYVSKEEKADAEKGKDGKNWGKVLVPRPKSKAIETTSFGAPAWLREQFGAPDKARVHASLYVESGHAIMFATLDGSDRGVEVNVDIARLTEGANVGSMGSKFDKLDVDFKASTARGMLVVNFGTEKTHGHAGWGLERLMQSPTLETLVPDELVLERKEGKLTIAQELDVAKLRSSGLTSKATIDISRWETAKAALGAYTKAEVFTNDFSHGARIALVSTVDEDNDGKRPGVELDLTKDFVKTLDAKIKDIVTKTRNVVGSALSKTRSAGQISSIGLKVQPSASGIMIERGTDGEPDHMYARWGWGHLGGLIEGDIEALEPDEFRLATKSLALEVTELDNLGENLPASAKQIGKLHPLLRDSLKVAGLSDGQYIDLQLDGPDARVTDEKARMLGTTGHVYDVDPALRVTGGKALHLQIALDALLAQVLPHGGKFKKKAEQPESERKKEGTHITGDVSLADEGQGIDLSVGVTRKKGAKEMTFEIKAGWTFQQVLNLVMNMSELVTEDGKPNLSGAAGLLTPERITGKFATEKWEIEFGNAGKRSEYNCAADDVPGLAWVLGTVLDPQTIEQSKMHLNLPSEASLTESLKKAAGGGFVELVGCTLEVPRKDPEHPDLPPQAKLYEIKFSVSPLIFKKLLYLIPGAGAYIKLADTIWGFLKDPKGALESLRYTPEAMVMIFENAPEIIGVIKDKGWKGVAMALVMGGDISTKQAVMANRIMKKMKAAGWKKGDKPKGDLEGIPADYLEWLSEQPASQLVAMDRLEQQMKEAGVVMEDETPHIPDSGKLPSVEEIDAKIESVAAGYKEFAELQHKAHPKDPNEKPSATQADLDAAAAQLRTRVSKLIKAGGKPTQTFDAGGLDTTEDKPTLDADRDFVNVDDFKLDEEDEAAARKIFEAQEQEKQEGGDKTVVTIEESQWLIRAYGGLSIDQLGELLSIGSTQVTTMSGKTVEMPLLDDHRGYVRTLFVRKIEAEGFKLESGGGGAPSDRDIVAAYHSFKSRSERDAQRGKGSTIAGDEDRKGTGEGEKEDGKGEGDGDGELGSLDEAFEDEPATAKSTTGSGATDNQIEGSETEQEETPEGSSTVAEDQMDAPPEDISLQDRMRPSPREAQSWVTFDTARGKAETNTAAVKEWIGNKYAFKGDVVEIKAIELAAYAARGTGADQVFEYTIEIQVAGKPTGGLTVPLAYTFAYTPAEGKSKGFGGMPDVAGFGQKLNDAVTITGKNVAVPSATPRFEHHGWDMEVLALENVEDVDVARISATLVIKFHRIPDDSVTVKGPDGPQLVHAGDTARMVGTLMRDEK